MLLLTPASGLKIGDLDGAWKVVEIRYVRDTVEIDFQNINSGYTYTDVQYSDAAYVITR